MNRKINLSVTPKQNLFINSMEDEVLFGGAAGGGKSYAQLMDSLLFACMYKGSRQLLLRRTFPELNRSLLLLSYEIFPTSVAAYNKSEHIWRFVNGSIVEFGYCDSEGDVTKYQSAEYDVIRFDELTHFTEYQYTYLISRNRGANDFPKQIKSTTNPGGIGHNWVKARFIDGKNEYIPYTDDNNRKSIFIPAVIKDNSFLMKKDPMYVNRLKSLPTKERETLLEGKWDVFDGQYFDNFDRSFHVTSYMPKQKDEKLFCSMDYGLDMFAFLVAAVNPYGRVRVLKEVYKSKLLVSEAAAEIEKTGYKIGMIFAPPDLWGRNGQTGRSIADIFFENGYPLTRVSANRVAGWLTVKEALEKSVKSSGMEGLTITNHCPNLIRSLNAIARDRHNPSDVAITPHELTHAPDALRYLYAGLPKRLSDKVDTKALYSNIFVRGNS